MFYLNTIEQMFLFVAQVDQLEVCLTYSRLLTGIPKLVVFQNLRWNSNKTSLILIGKQSQIWRGWVLLIPLSFLGLLLSESMFIWLYFLSRSFTSSKTDLNVDLGLLLFDIATGSFLYALLSVSSSNMSLREGFKKVELVFSSIMLSPN